MLAHQLIPQDLARLATPRHRINVYLCEALRPQFRIIAIGEALRVIIKDIPQELILNILPPQRLSIILLQMPHLMPAVSRTSACLFLRRCPLCSAPLRAALSTPLPRRGCRLRILIFRHIGVLALLWRRGWRRLVVAQDVLERGSWIGARWRRCCGAVIVHFGGFDCRPGRAAAVEVRHGCGLV